MTATENKQSADIQFKDTTVLDSDADVYLQEVDYLGTLNSNIGIAIKKRYPDVSDLYKYRSKAIRKGQAHLGEAQIITCADGKYVCNLFAASVGINENTIRTNYEALYSALETVAKYFSDKTIAIPFNMGCNEGKGKWQLVYAIIKQIFQETDNRIIICMDEES